MPEGSLEAAERCFIMSIDDAPEIRAIFAGFRIEEARHNFRIAGRPTAAAERIISRIQGGK